MAGRGGSPRGRGSPPGRVRAAPSARGRGQGQGRGSPAGAAPSIRGRGRPLSADEAGAGAWAGARGAPAEEGGSAGADPRPRSSRRARGCGPRPGPGSEQQLRAVLARLSLARRDTVEAAALVNELAARLVQAVKRDISFHEVEKLGAGSYYEHLKISEPDEFDIMLKVPIPRIQLDECDATGAFHYVTFKRHPQKHLDKFLDDDGKLSADTMLLSVRNIIKEEVKNITNMTVTVKRKKPGSPAVTLLIEKPQTQISVDIILALEYRSQSWPRSTQDGLNIDQWLGKKVKQAFKQNPLYLVPKHAKNEKVIKASTWRLSFSHIEKDIIKNHGNTKTCCEYDGVKCCRKECLKLLKYLLEQLKAKHRSRRELDKFFSYHAKTAFFHMCARRPEDKDWQFKDLDRCFHEFLDYFLDCLQKSDLPHFFIPKHNLFSPDLVDMASSNFLSREIKYELNNSFPIFKLEN